MATAAEQTDIAVLKSKVENIEKVIQRIETKIDAQTDLYITRTEFNEFKSRWVLSHTIAGILGALITGLSVYFLTHRT